MVQGSCREMSRVIQCRQKNERERNMLEFLIEDVMHLKMTTPTWFGWFHILWLLLTVGATVLLCMLYKQGKIKNVTAVVFITSLAVLILEIYKQTQYSFSYEGGALSGLNFATA